MNSTNAAIVDLSPQVSSHETRLQRLEAVMQDVSVSVAEVRANQENLVETVKSSREDLSNKIENGFGTLNATADKLLGKLAEHTERIQETQSRLKPLEDYHKLEASRTEIRNNYIKKALISTVLTALGVLGTKIFEMAINFANSP